MDKYTKLCHQVNQKPPGEAKYHYISVNHSTSPFSDVFHEHWLKPKMFKRNFSKKKKEEEDLLCKCFTLALFKKRGFLPHCAPDTHRSSITEKKKTPLTKVKQNERAKCWFLLQQCKRCNHSGGAGEKNKCLCFNAVSKYNNTRKKTTKMWNDIDVLKFFFST